jgi:ribosome maturation factor RimP
MILRQERTGIDKKFFELCTKVVADEGLTVYDMDYLPGSQCLRLFIVQGETDTALIEDCIKIDRALSPYIDESDWMPEVLNLEVSSPGLFRQLTSIEHFKSVCGKEISLNLKSNIAEYTEDKEKIQKKQNKAKNVVCLLSDVKEDSLEIEIFGIKISLPFTEIKKANLETKI